MLCCGTRIHERLSNDRQARIHCCRFVDVKNEVRILDKIYPKPQWKTVKERTFCLNILKNIHLYHEIENTSLLTHFNNR
jgi:hypothetical protein